MKLSLVEILSRNQGQVLSAELIAGIAYNYAMTLHEDEPPPLACSLSEVAQVGEFTLQAELAELVLNELKAQHQAQWAEVEQQLGGDMNPDYEAMLERERAGAFVLFTARDKTGRMIGNIGCYVTKSIHNQKLVASEDTMYVAQEARKGMFAIRFFQFAERQLKQLGVQRVSLTARLDNPVNRLWARQGYVESHRVMTKDVGE